MKRRSMLVHGSCMAAGLLGGWTASLAAAGPVIRFGQSASLTGAQANYGRDVRDGIAAAFAAASKTGIARFELVTLDDGGVKARCAQNVATLIELGVTGIVGLTSGAGAEACVAAVDKAQMALLGTASGNMGIRAQGVSSAFHVRAGYDLEYQRMISYVKDFGMRRVSVVTLEDTSRANIEAMNLALHSMSITPQASVRLDRNMTSFDGAAATLIESRPDCVLFTTNAAPVAGIIDKMTAAKYPGLFYASSFAGQDLVNTLVQKKQSCVMSTVVPRPTAMSVNVVQRCQQDLAALGGETHMGLTVLEGYIAGRTAVEAAQAVLKNGALTRARLRESLAGLRTELGGYKVEFAGGTQGSRFVDLLAVDRYGRLVG